MRGIGQFFKRLTGARAGGSSAVAVEPKVKFEYDISSSHPKNVLRFCIHPEDELRVKKMLASKPSGIMDWLSQINLIAGTADLFWKSGRALSKAKESGVKEALKGEGCCFNHQSQQHLAFLVRQSSKNAARLEYLEQVAKGGLTKGSPPPPVRPLAPSKQEANGKGNGDGKGNGNGKGKGKGKGNGKGDGDGNGNGNGNGKGKGNGNGNGNGNGGPPALSEHDTLPEPFDYPF